MLATFSLRAGTGGKSPVYTKLKAFLRKMAERTVAGLLIALDACADIFKPRNALMTSRPAVVIPVDRSPL
jgi:hypothetical protein